MSQSPKATLDHLQWADLCDALADRLKSPAARGRLVGADETDPYGVDTMDRILPRSGDPAVVSEWLRQLDGIDALRAVEGMLGGNALAASLRNIEDVDRCLTRAASGAVVDLEELCAIADVLESAARVAEGLAELAQTPLENPAAAGVEAICRAQEGAQPPVELRKALARSLDRSGEPSLKDEASEALGRLRRRANQARRGLVTSADRMVRRGSIASSLAGDYWTEREGRIVLPVRADRYSHDGAAAGIIHGSSSTGQTLYIEPRELVELSNAQRTAMAEVAAEERRIVTRLSNDVGASAETLRSCLDRLVALDHIQARWQLSADVGGLAPKLVQAQRGATMDLPVVRHPLMVLAGTEVVPNDLSLNVGNALVVSGPNAGGKTVALKTVGMVVLMAQAGLRIPTERGAVVPLFRRVVTDVGDDQSISANLSTFSAHVGHVLVALKCASDDGDGTLVLLDEVAVGTDPDQGAALAESILMGLVERGASVVVTTHYERLKLLATSAPEQFVNAAVGFDLENLRPTFKVRVGTPGSSSALAVAQRLGMPAPILAQAETLLADDRVAVDALLREVEGRREQLDREYGELQRERMRLAAKRAAVEARERGQLDSAARRRKRAHDAAASELNALERDIVARRKALRRSEQPRRQGGVTDPAERNFARQARRELGRARPADPRVPGAPPTALKTGDEVVVASLGASGKVIAIKGRKVTVQLALAKTTVELDDLRPKAPQKPGRGRAKSKALKGRPVIQTAPSTANRHFGGDPEPVSFRVDNVADLRGSRAEEAVTLLEVSLDRAISADEDVVVVQHGHGSGALRQVVREHLARLRHVHKHRAGLPAEGGDAVTVVWLKG